jgi:predicted nucleic acid-binding Zn ribbon protein
MKLAQLRNHWDQVVGQAIASHSAVADFTDGVLTIRAESTVWATQLTYLIPQLTDTIRRNLKGLTIAEIRVTGPAAGYTRKWARGGSQDTKQIRRSLAMALVGLDE